MWRNKNNLEVCFKNHKSTQDLFELFTNFKFHCARLQGYKVTDVSYHICVDNMAAEWNHCLSTGTIAGSPPVTRAEYKLCDAPWAPTCIKETCEQTVGKAHKGPEATANHVAGLFPVFFFLIKLISVEKENSPVQPLSEIRPFPLCCLVHSHNCSDDCDAHNGDTKRGAKRLGTLLMQSTLSRPCAPTKKLTSGCSAALNISSNVCAYKKTHTVAIEKGYFLFSIQE